MSEASIMSPVGQEIEEPLNSSILFNSDSTCSSLELSQNSIATEGNCSDASMDFQIDRFSVSDTEADSAITLLKSLNSESPSSSFVSRRNDNSAILRLNNELLKAKRSNWEVVDALGKAYEDIKNLRLREQRLNAILSTCNGKRADTNGFPESLSPPDSKIIELQLALRREEAFKTRGDLRTMIEERDKLKEKLGKSESDRRLVSLTSDQRARELEISQNYINDLTANIKEKDAKLFSAQDKLISLELQIKTKDEEMDKISEEKDNLRDAVIRSEQEIEFLTEKLRKLSLPKQEHAKCFTKGRDHTQESQTFDQSDGKVSYAEENMGNFFRDETRLEKGMQYLESRHNQDMKIIQELSSKLKEWERFMKSMNDHALDANQQQLQARTKIADYIRMLEQQLHELKNNRPISIYDYGYSSEAVKQNDRGYIDQDLREDYQVSPQMVQRTQAENANFERYLKRSQSDFDEQGVLRDVSDHDPFDLTDDMDEEDDFELASRFRSSARHLVQPDDVRMARVTTIDGFVCPHSPPGMDNEADKNTPKRPPRKTDSRKRRKLPNITRKLSRESGHSTDSLVTRSDETASVTSFESHMSRDNARFRRGSGGSSNRRLPPVPSGEEINLSKQSIVEDRPATEPPSVISIYKVKEGPRSVNNQSQDSGLGKSEKNDPTSPSHASHKFSFSSLRRKFSKGKESSGTHVDVDSLRKTKKGLFKQKLSLLRRRKRRRNSIGSVSSASESFRTITPLNSDKEDVADIGKEPFDWGRSQSPRTTSTSYKKGGVFRKSRNVSDRHRRACLWLVFQHLNPIELCGLARVCREWREISEHPSLWKQVTLEDIPVNNMALQAVSRRCSCMQYLKLKGLKITKSRDKNHDSKPDDLSCYLERGLEFLLKAAGSSMQSFHIEDCGIFLTDRCLSLVGCYCRELKEMVYVSDTFPVCPEALWALWACRQLHTLRVPPMFPSYHPGRFNDKSLEMISNCWPNLRQLTVGGPSITSAGLIYIAKGCLRLQELELDRSILINEEIAHTMCLCGLRGLETISFTFTPVSPGAIKELLGACPRLERIEVHIGISDYFTDVEGEVSQRKYRRIVKKLTALQEENEEFARVLWIKSDYG